MVCAGRSLRGLLRSTIFLGKGLTSTTHKDVTPRRKTLSFKLLTDGFLTYFQSRWVPVLNLPIQVQVGTPSGKILGAEVSGSPLGK